MEPPQIADPYAPPQANLELSPEANLIRRQGKLIVVKRDVPLPERCVKCNRDATGIRLSPRLFHYQWWLTLSVIVLLLLFWPLALIVALVGRKSARVEFSLCGIHQRQRQVMTGVTLVFLSLSVLVPWIGFSTTLIDHNVTIVLGLVALLIGLVAASVRGQPLRITRFIDDRLHLRGTGLAFRESFDEFDEQGLPRIPSMSR